MAVNVREQAGEDRPRASLLYDPTFRSIIYQVVTAVIFVALIWWIWGNTLDNLKRANIASGFGFLNGRAGFQIGQSIIEYSSDSTYIRALLVGLLNTLLVALTGIVTASIIGFLVGIGRLSNNWLIAKLSLVYVEVFRNIPPLLVIFFWYFAVIAALPEPRSAIQFGLDISLSNRGFYMPRPIFGHEFGWTIAAFVVGIAGAWALGRWAYRRQMATGQPFPSFWVGLALLIVLTGIVFTVTGAPLGFDVPVKTRFNLRGGMALTPEFMSLLLALGIYTASFIAEIVRAGILSVSHGQTEAAHALGLRRGRTLRLVVLPQALRVIIPPLTSEFLNLTKNSSLAVAIGYADLVAIGGSVLNQTGQAVEVVLIWMVVYLGLSLITSFAMNRFNSRMALVER